MPKEILEAAGHECVVASVTANEARGILGGRVTPDGAVADMQLDRFDAVIIVGGPGAPKLAHVPEVISIIREAVTSGKLVCAICIAPTVLAQAGVLKGKKATVFYTPDSYDMLQSAGAHVQGKPGKLADVVVDGKLVTARGPDVAREFGETVKKLLE
jgi:protease I